MEDKKIPAAQILSEATDRGQPICSSNSSIAPEVKKCKSNDLQTITLREIFAHPHIARPPVIEGMLGIGAYILAGAPKIGKSFLVWQIAYAVATGNDLWGLSVRQGSVLVLALEDTEDRIYSREERMLSDETQTPKPDNLHAAFAADGIEGDLEGQIDRFMVEHPDTIMVVVDILQRVRKHGEKVSYANDSDTMLALKAIADKHQICLLVVHHTRKAKADDIFEMISGTNGLGGSADGALVLTKESRTGSTATLSVIARDFADMVVHLTKDKRTLNWMLDYFGGNDELEEPQDLILDSVVSLMEETAEWEGSPTEMLMELGLDIQPNKLTQHLHEEAGKLRGKYGIGVTNSRTHDGRRIKLFHVDQKR